MFVRRCLSRTAAMVERWFLDPISLLGLTVLKTTGIYLAVVTFTRLYGLRSFAKITGFDFAMTVAVGSAIATTMFSADPPLIRGIVAIGTLYSLQKLIAHLRRRASIEPYVDNHPLLVVENGRIIEDALDQSNLSELDLRAKLRQSDVKRLEEVRAVVLETTGDVSVIAAEEGDDVGFGDWVFQGVRGIERFEAYDPEDTRQG